MPISDELVGREYPASAPYVVTREKIAEFAAALGDSNPAYASADPLAPPTFAVVLAFRAWDLLFDDPDLNMQLSRTIHGDQKFEWARPLRAGDEVTATLRIDKIRARGLSAFVTVSVSLDTVGGEHVCTATSTLLHTWPEEAS